MTEDDLQSAFDRADVAAYHASCAAGSTEAEIDDAYASACRALDDMADAIVAGLST